MSILMVVHKQPDTHSDRVRIVIKLQPPHQGYSIHTVFYSGCSEAVINSHAGGHAWWRYTLNNASETNTGYIAPYAQMSAAEFYARFLNTAAYNDMLAGFPNRPTNAYEYEYINR